MKSDPYEKFIEKNVSISPCLFTEIQGIRVTWEVNGVCNLKCAHCCVSAENKCIISPDLEKYKKNIDQLVEDRVKAIYISGGEPFLWDGIFEFIRYAKERGIGLISLATNATLLTKETVEKLEKAGTDKILISLDHYIPDLHDKLRGIKGTFDAAIKGVENVKKYSNIFIRVGTVIWKENYQNLEEFVKFLIEKGVDEVIFSWLMKTGRAVNYPEIFVDKEYYFFINEKLERLKKKHSREIKISFHRFQKLRKNSRDCPGGEKFYYINYRGQFGPCSWISKLFPEKYLTKDSLLEKPLSTLKNSSEFQSFIRDKEERYSKFGPGCPAVCTIENGNFFSRDPLLEDGNEKM